MGADMVASYVDFPREHNLEEEQAKLISFAEKLDQTTIESIQNDAFYDPEIDDFQTSRVKIIEAIRLGFEALESRRTTSFPFQGRVLYLTGGLTWGGSPTDEFDQISALAYVMDLKSDTVS